MKRFALLFQASLLILFSSLAAWAADPPDPPGRVARVQYMSGQVSVQPQGTDDWVEASANRPLTNADNIWADKDSRAELNAGGGVFRISSETSLTLTNVTNDSVQVSLHQGVLNVHIRHLYGGEVWEIDTPNLAFTVSKSGDYRFDTDPNGDSTRVTVWKGEGEATGQGQAVRVRSGEQADFTGGNSLAHQIHSAPRPDGFDDWCRVRDSRQDHSISARYVAPGVVGSEDLDDYGTWRQTPDYGAVWVPTSVSPGWAPYSSGHWAWVEPWGWTWVDNYAWGFAPFHYGRWVSWGGSWGWAPGPYWGRPWYSPALVAWWGGPGWGGRFGFGGGFGWCPLGFGEPFFPWYRVSPFYFRNVNISNTRIVNITHVTNNYFNNRSRTGLYGRNGIGMPHFANKPGAFTAVSRNTLERGLPVRGNSVRISPNDLRGANSLSRVDANPTREARLGPKANAPAARPLGNTLSRTGAASATRNAGSLMPRPGASAGRSMQSPMSARGPGRQNDAMSSVAPGGHYVPRPPQNMNERSSFSNRGFGNGGSRSEPAQMAFNHGVPRPPERGIRPSSEASGRFGASADRPSRSVPRPPARSFERPTMNARNSAPSSSLGRSERSYSAPRGMPNSVPRPMGRVQPAPRSYSGSENRGSYSSRAYGGYGSSGGYNSPRFSGSPNSGSYGGRGGYSAPSHSYGGSGGGFHGNSGSHASSGSHSSGGSHGGGRR